MAVCKRTYRDPKTKELKESDIWWYSFYFAGHRIRESAMTPRKTLAGDAERKRRAELEEKSITQTQRQKAADCTQSVTAALKNYEETYEGKNRAWVKSVCKVASERFAGRLLVDLTEDEIRRYRNRRKEEGAAERSINIECDTLARAFGTKYSNLWPKLKRLREPKSSGRALSEAEVKALLTILAGIQV